MFGDNIKSRIPSIPKTDPPSKMKFTIGSIDRAKKKLQTGSDTNFEYLKPIEKQAAKIFCNIMGIKN